MRIKNIEVIPYGSPIKNFADAYAAMNHTNAVLVKIHTDEGMAGFGEACAWQHEFYGETVESISYAIKKYLAPKLIGLDPLNIASLLTKMDETFAKSTCAKEGLDLALFDLAGRILKVPVYRLLNGCFRDRIPAACEIGIAEPEGMAANARELLKLGLNVLKIKGSQDIEKDILRIKAVREAVGDEIGLRLDPNAHWTTTGTLRAMRQLEDCHLQLLEQPIPEWDLKGMAHIRKSIGIPLMADESIWTPQDVIRIADHEAADIINIKISKTGGLFNAKKVETVAESLGLICMVGTEIEPGFSLAAKLHLAASMKNLPLACEFTELSLLKESILKNKIEIEDGYIKVPDGIGLGVEVDDLILKKQSLPIRLFEGD